MTLQEWADKDVVISLRNGQLTIEHCNKGIVIGIIDHDNTTYEQELAWARKTEKEADHELTIAFFDGYIQGMERAKYLLEQPPRTEQGKRGSRSAGRPSGRPTS